MGCPRCGLVVAGPVVRTEVSAGVFRCDNVVVAGSAPGPVPGVGSPATRACGRVYQEGSIAELFCACGMGAVARCVECGTDMCLDHVMRGGDGLVRCGSCGAKFAAAQSAEAEREARARAAAFDPVVSELLNMPEPARKLMMVSPPMSRMVRDRDSWGTGNKIELPEFWDRIWPELGSARRPHDRWWSQADEITGSEPLVDWFRDHAAAAGYPTQDLLEVTVVRGAFGRTSTRQVSLQGWRFFEVGRYRETGRWAGFARVDLLAEGPAPKVGMFTLYLMGAILEGRTAGLEEYLNVSSGRGGATRGDARAAIWRPRTWRSR